MEILTGTEMRDDYLSFEVGRAARRIVEEVMPVKPGENVVISADTRSDSRVVTATAQAVFAAGAHPVVIIYETQAEPHMEPPAPVAAALTKADVWFEFGTQGVLYTGARVEAVKAGCRHACWAGLDADAIVRTIGRVNHRVMGELGKKLHDLAMAAEVVRITCPNGSNLVCPVDRNPPVYFVGSDAPGAGYSQMLGGQSNFTAVIDQVNGTIVFDGMLREAGPLMDPVYLTVENGYITKIEGKRQARIFDRWMAKWNSKLMYRLAHISFGFNPGVKKTTGRMVEDERVFGCMDIGMGPQNLGAPCHADGMILSPSIRADDVELEREGVYVHPDLVAICQELGVPGY